MQMGAPLEHTWSLRHGHLDSTDARWSAPMCRAGADVQVAWGVTKGSCLAGCACNRGLQRAGRKPDAWQDTRRKQRHYSRTACAQMNLRLYISTPCKGHTLPSLQAKLAMASSQCLHCTVSMRLGTRSILHFPARALTQLSRPTPTTITVHPELTHCVSSLHHGLRSTFKNVPDFPYKSSRFDTMRT